MAGPWWAKGLVAVMERLSPMAPPRAFARLVTRLAVVERPPSGLYDAKGRRIPESGFRADVELRRQVWERTEALWRERVTAPGR